MSYSYNSCNLIYPCFGFAGAQLLSTTLGVKEYIQTEFERVEEEVILPHKQLFPSAISLNDFFWAFGILRSRAFSRLRGQNLVLIPLADLVSLISFLCCSNWFKKGNRSPWHLQDGFRVSMG